MTEAGCIVRPARTHDIRAVRRLVDLYSGDGTLLDKPMVTLYEDVQEFLVADASTSASGDGDVLGCGALHVVWEDLAEVRTLAVEPAARGNGIGHALLTALLDRARAVGVQRVFCLTFEVDFFARHGFEVIEGEPVAPDVYAELLSSYDEGVAELLGLERVKPNILGNTRMLLTLSD